MWAKNKGLLSNYEPFEHNVVNILTFYTVTTIFSAVTKKLPTHTHTHLFVEQSLSDLRIFKRAGGKWRRYLSERRKPFFSN